MQDLFQLVRTEIRGAWRYRWWAMIVAWAICLVGWLVVFTMPDMFQARAQVFVDADSRLAEVIGEVGVEPGVGSRVFIVRQAMLGRPQLERVASVTGLDKRAKTPLEKDELIDDLLKKISVESGRVRQSQNLYTITFDDSDRNMALAVVTSLLDTFVEDVLKLKEKGTEDVSSYLSTQLSHYAGLLSKSERELADFKKRYVGLLPGENGGVFERLQDELDQLKLLRYELQIEQDRRDELRRQLTNESPYVDEGSEQAGSPMVVRNPTESAITDLESRRATLLLTFTERHPDVIAIDEQLVQLRAKRDAERAAMLAGGGGIEGARNSTNPVYQSVQITLNETAVEIASLQSQIAQREATIRQLNGQVDTIPEVEATFAELNRDYDQYKSLYDELLLRRERERLGSVGEQSDVVSFNIIDPPAASLIPVSPRRFLLLFAVLVLGLGAGGAVAVGLHQLKPVFHDSRSLQRITGRPVLGVVSMTWLERHKVKSRVDISSFAVAGFALVSVFIIAVLLKNQMAELMHALISQSAT